MLPEGICKFCCCFFLLFPISTFNISKSHKMSSGNISDSEVISKKPQGGMVCGKHLPLPLGLIFFNVSAKWAIYCNPIRPWGEG